MGFVVKSVLGGAVTMRRRKIISLLSGICGLLLGSVMLIATIMDAVPKSLYIVFSIVCMANAALTLLNFKNKK